MVRRFTSVATFFALLAVGLVATAAAASPGTTPPTISMVSAASTPKVIPAGTVMMLDTVLKRTKLNIVPVGPGLTFKVAVHNAGSSTRHNTAVKLLIAPQRSNLTTERTVTLLSIGSGKTKTVKFQHLGAVAFGRKTSLVISVGGQTRIYPILFSLPG